MEPQHPNSTETTQAESLRCNDSTAFGPHDNRGGNPGTRQDWRRLLPQLDGLPLLPCGAGQDHKAPMDPKTGRPSRNWPVQRFTPEEIAGMGDRVRCVGTRCGPDAGGLLVGDLDGQTAIKLAIEKGLDPSTAGSWQVRRDNAADRLKVMFRVAEHLWHLLPKGKAEIITKPGDKAAGLKREGVELFWGSGQVVVLGEHVASGGHYCWHGTPADLETIDEAHPLWPWVLALLGAPTPAERPPLPAAGTIALHSTDERPPRPMEVLYAALDKVPPFDHGQGRRSELLGLCYRLHVELGRDAALAVMRNHSPAVRDMAGYFKKAPDRINPGSIWPYLRENYRVDIRRPDLEGGRPKQQPSKKPRKAPSQAPEGTAEAQATDAPQPHFRCLGQHGDGFFYQVLKNGGIVRLTRAQHTSSHLVSLAPLSYWEEQHPGERTGANWTAAASALYEQQQGLPPFDPRKIRGRGAWVDRGRTVFHLGDRLDVDGQVVSIAQFDGEHTYALRPALPALPAEPLDDFTGQRITRWSKAAGWVGPFDYLYVVGQIVLGPVGGVLTVRPQVIVSGPRGAAKTEGCLRPTADLWGGGESGYCLSTEAPSAAGVRQSLAGDVLPVAVDEWENAAHQFDELLRAAYNGGETARGTASQEVIRQLIRSSFMLAGINTEGLGDAASSRTVVVRKTFLPRAAVKAQEEQAVGLITPENGRRLIRRTLTHLPTLLHNATTIERAVTGLDGRRARVYGLLLAGARLMVSTDRLADEVAAHAWLREMQWEPDQQAEEDLRPDSESRRTLAQLLQHSIRWDDLGNRAREASVRELMDMAAGSPPRSPDDPDGRMAAAAQDDAVQALGRLGLKVGGGGLYVAKRVHPAIFRGTPWADGNHLARLRELDGASSTKVHIPTRGTQHTVWVPGTDIDGFPRVEVGSAEVAA